MRPGTNFAKSRVLPKLPSQAVVPAAKELYDANKAEPEDEEDVPLRVKIEEFVSGKVELFIDGISLVVSVLTFSGHIADTYFAGFYDEFLWFDIGVMLFYLSEFLLQFYIAQHKFIFLRSDFTMIRISSIVPLSYVFYLKKMDVIYKITLVLRSFRIVRYLRKFLSFGNKNEVSRQIYTIVLTVFSLIIVTSGIIQVFESDIRSQVLKGMKDECLKNTPGIEYCDIPEESVYIHHMIYFVVVTLSTVGYGDFTMQSAWAKLCVIILLCLAVALIPNQTSELIRLYGMQSEYARDAYNSTSDSTHVVVSGILQASALSNFCQELFHTDHGMDNLLAVILQKSPPSPEMLELLQSPNYDNWLRYLQGDPLEKTTLKRAEIAKASACILLTDKYVKDPISLDHKNILLGIAVKNYVANNNNKQIRICMQLIKPESKSHFLKFAKGDDQIVVVEEIKMNLLAKSCFCPGIISLLGNLVKSAGEPDLESIKHTYLKEYLEGMGHEIYRVKLSPHLAKNKFNEIAAEVYEKHQGIVFCLEIQIGGEALILLNPGEYEIPASFRTSAYVYVICEDKDLADKVTTMDEENGPGDAKSGLEKERTEFIEEKEMELTRVPDWIESVKTEDLDHSGDADNINLFELDYAVLEEPLNLMSVTKTSVERHSKVKDHIVVCGIHSALHSFILPLRAKYLKELMYILILNPEQPSPELWSQISIFPNLIFVKGSPLVHEDLIRAGIKTAKKAVIMDSGKMIDQDGLPDLDNDRMIDAESIFIYKAIKKCNPSLQIMIELVHPSNIEFLENRSNLREDMQMAKKSDEFNYEYVSLYASGEVYISAIIDTLTCQSYYNPHIVTILKQLLSSGQSNANTLKIMGICEEANLQQSNFWQIPVPEDYRNKTYGELFKYLCKKRELIPIGLYRLPGATDNERPYVYTNPPQSVKLTGSDRVFVLARMMPVDLKEAPNEAAIQGIGMDDQSLGLDFDPGVDDDNEANVHLNASNIKDDGGAEKGGAGGVGYYAERMESNIGIGSAISTLEKYLANVEGRLDHIASKLKQHEEMIGSSIKETIAEELDLITTQED